MATQAALEAYFHLRESSFFLYTRDLLLLHHGTATSLRLIRTASILRPLSYKFLSSVIITVVGKVNAVHLCYTSLPSSVQIGTSSE